MKEHILIIQGYIDHLEYMKKNAYELFDRKQADRDIEAFKAAIKALEQEPCGDVISRQAVLDINESHHGQMPNHINHQIWQEIKDLPSVNPQAKTGHWIYIGNSEVNGLKICKCSYCHKRTYGSTVFCPNCGAKMIDTQERSSKECR